ncbi:MAG TPA: hypothetical protein PLZ36_16445 [Armatimonadota bacterium]|nr:hypothetical protein [Armatimonadota bacterium]
MDISALAVMMTEVLQRYLMKTPQSSAASAGQQSGMAEQAKGLFELVQAKLSGEPESAQTLRAFEQAPAQQAGALQGVLTQRLSRDPGFLAQATEHVRRLMPGAGERIGAAGDSPVEKAKGAIADLFGGQTDGPEEKAA